MKNGKRVLRGDPQNWRIIARVVGASGLSLLFLALFLLGRFVSSLDM